jgi:cysteine-rich repeat protein
VCTQTACDLSTTGTDSDATSTSTTGTDTDATSTSTSTSTTGTDTGGAACGNGVVDPGEACDDGNLVDDDGCANDCGLGGGVCLPNDPLEISAATIEGDTLKVEVSYGGGCETHVIDMCWDGIFAESFPVQTWIALSHDGNDDSCDAWITEVRSIDLSAMKSAYQEGYQTQNGTILIQIEGWAQGAEYTF